MNFQALLERLVEDTVGSVGLFSPELALCGAIVVLLLGRLFGLDRLVPPYLIATAGALVSFLLSYVQFLQGDPMGGSQEMFTGLLVYDKFTVFFRLFLLLFLVFVIALTVLTQIPDREDGPDFYTLLLGSTVGMMLMVSSNHLLMLFLAVEMTSVPSYAMVGFHKGRRQSSEASLKYVVYGAGAAGVMLYGVSLLAGLLGTANLPEMAERLNLLSVGAAGVGDPTVRTVVLAMLLILVGIAFKLSVVPFHFWCPDAFEGASAEVAGFLSVASKGAAFALLVRLALAFIGESPDAWANINLALGLALGALAAVTATFGNLAAYAQTNMKRLLAYSTIAHAGYMLMAVSAMMVLLHGGETGLSDPRHEAARALGGLLFYLWVYLFMNLGAFAIVALIRNQIFSEELDDYAGLAQQAPVLCVGMLVCVFSLIGLPPLGGFFGKWYVFQAVFQAGHAHWAMWALLAIGVLNTVFSLFYYVRVLKAMFIASRPADARRAVVPGIEGAYVMILSVSVLALGCAPFLVNAVSRTVYDVAAVLIR
ncbi:MAG TPA: NADH-quinone oxidoreductase subunit N [Planctomycetaceae bacterium]|nr:NADH-quinone oxidoreductase subunit N [Planctomycetaceae bacterium]